TRAASTSGSTCASTRRARRRPSRREVALDELGELSNGRRRGEAEVPQLAVGDRVADALHRVEEDRVLLAGAAARRARPEGRGELELPAALRPVEGSGRAVLGDQRAQARAEAAPAPVEIDRESDDAPGALARIGRLAQDRGDRAPLRGHPRLVNREERGALVGE